MKPCWRTLCLTAALLACSAGPPGCTEPQSKTLGGKTVSAEVLERGRTVYRRNCNGCHGDEGRADTAAARASIPKPRDLSLGQYKYAGVRAGSLPTDADFRRLLRRGLDGTSMTGAPHLTDEDTDAVVQYIKTFSDRWEKGHPGLTIELQPNPFEADASRRIATRRGRELYHRRGQCTTCHPTYASADELESWTTRTEGGPGVGNIRDSKALQNSVYGRLLPPDFLSDTVRVGRSDRDVYRTLKAGVGGVPGHDQPLGLQDEEMWSLALYIRDLIRIRRTPEAHRLRQQWTSGSSPAPDG